MSRNRILALVAFYALLVGLTLFGFNTPTTASAQSCSPTYFTLSGALNATQSGTGIAVSMGFVDVFDVHHFDLMRNDSTIKDTAVKIHEFAGVEGSHTYLFTDPGPFVSGTTYYYWMKPVDADGCSNPDDWAGPADEKFQGVTAVVIDDFTVRRDSSTINVNIVEWTTVSEIDSVGFNIWQCPDGVAAPNASCTKLNILMIPSKAAGGTSGYSYRYDHNDGPYEARYWLETVDIGDFREFYGPARWLTGPTAVTISSINAYNDPFAGIFLEGVDWSAVGNVVLGVLLLIGVVLFFRWWDRRFPAPAILNWKAAEMADHPERFQRSGDVGSANNWT